MTAPRIQGPQAVFLDLDGTLCVSDRNPSPATLQALETAQRNGHKIFLCTGRALSMIPPAVLAIPWDGVVAGIGAYAEVGGQVILDQPYPPQAVDRIVRLFHQAGLVFIVETDTNAYMDLTQFHALGLEHTHGINREVASLIQTVRQGQIREWTAYQGEPVYNIAFLSADDAVLAALRRELEKEYYVVLHPPEAPGYITDLELVRRAVNKGSAISPVCHACGIPIDHSIAFGDSMNDREMFVSAALAIAMGNADDDIRAYADYICGTVQNDGLALAFRELGLT